MQTNWKQLLKALGLSESEAQIYLASLEVGPASVQDLAKKARVSRVTTYAVIEHLTDRGLMSSVEKGKKRLFTVESPERLVSVMQNRLQEMKTTLSQVEDSLHELKLVQRGAKPVVKMFEGDDAFQAVFTDLAANRIEHFEEFGNHDLIRNYVPKEEVLKRAWPHLRNAKRRVIMVADTVKTGHADSGNTVFLSSKQHACHGDVLIYGKNKVALASLAGKPISVIIESEPIAEMMRTLFSLAWKRASEEK